MARELSAKEAACVSSLQAGWSLQFGVRAELLKAGKAGASKSTLHPPDPPRVPVRACQAQHP